MLASRFSLERPLILQPEALRDCEAKVSQRRLARDAAPHLLRGTSCPIDAYIEIRALPIERLSARVQPEYLVSLQGGIRCQPSHGDVRQPRAANGRLR
jgi:hypothetical protein